MTLKIYRPGGAAFLDPMNDDLIMVDWEDARRVLAR